ncbi:proteinase [Cladophialophora carrionii]|uniref:Proteinase n=1 Tax=Cladophialophora carrionii TaxID=86049 RepID=A0A1C1D279_9EURO|nr:proteinase [Cladophialophora carrionii]
MWIKHTGLMGAVAVGLAYTGSAFLLQYPADQHDASQGFNWTGIRPSKELKYHKCYSVFECARLEVPLDWSNLSNANTVTLAITRLPAVVDVTDESFGGTIVINPGGPSGSGVATLLWSGKSIQNVVDSDKHFEVLSFDPRGVQFTTPSLSCFQDDSVRQNLHLMSVASGNLESNQYALDTKWSIDKSLGLLCAQTSNGRYPDGSSIRQYVSTALVAHDMVAIIDEVEAHRHRQLLSDGKHLQKQQAAIMYDSGDRPPLLNYWGLSYGTYLGNTFASMFPDRIGRMILDGVVDADDYAATGWTTNLQDNNKTWEKFFDYCFEAGDKCALSDASIRSPAEMQEKVEIFLAELKHNPLPLVENGNAYVLTYFDLKTTIHGHLYQPIQLWPVLALILRALMERDERSAISALRSPRTWYTRGDRHFHPSLPNLPFVPLLSQTLLEQELSLPTSYPWQQEAAISILCGDGDDITSRTKEQFAEYLTLLESQSPVVGSVWAEITLPCVHWQKVNRPSAENRFTGPFASNLSDYDPRGSPLLFIGNTADPVTPVGNALKMSKSHEGSVVLTQDMPGHCAGSSNPSVCISSIVKAFFANGTLPEAGLVCEAALKPWDIGH